MLHPMFEFIGVLGRDVYGDRLPLEAAWNPLLAGSLLLAVVAGTNVAQSIEFADKTFQIRTTLHLYDALRQRDLISQVEVLELISTIFSSDTHVWFGGKPEQKDYLHIFTRVSDMGKSLPGNLLIVFGATTKVAFRSLQ